MGGSSVAGSTRAGSLAGSTTSRPDSMVSTPPRPQSREISRPTSRATSRARTADPEGSDLSPSEVPGTRDWYLEMKDPPQTATYARGPFDSKDLVERLGLNNGEVREFILISTSETDSVSCRFSSWKSWSLFIKVDWIR